MVSIVYRSRSLGGARNGDCDCDRDLIVGVLEANQGDRQLGLSQSENSNQTTDQIRSASIQKKSTTEMEILIFDIFPLFAESHNSATNSQLYCSSLNAASTGEEYRAGTLTAAVSV